MAQEDRILKPIRAMAWQRAKGELFSMLETFWPEYDKDTGVRIPSKFDSFNDEIRRFISNVETNGLHE